MEISVAEAAQILDVSPRRVRALIDAGRVQARKVGGRWLVDAAALPRPHRSRPMAAERAWEILAETPAPATRQAAYRLRQRRARLREDTEPERLLSAWVVSRGRRERFGTRDPQGVLADERVVASGLSDDRARISGGALVEGYVRVDDLAAVRRSHLLRPDGAGANVVLHVVEHLPAAPVPPLVLAADLAEHDRPRELARARELIRQALA